jgi:hypothetical protein
MDAAALETVVRGIVASLPSPAMGPVMAALREQHAGSSTASRRARS